ncbi:hypothetical protein M9H77_14227 [Catharanthus roseus]|uniref:Uncharacterized protein n=1 Tax=Catharanthus roseus TaxID=4058 RepID=A0ACC0BMM1_CATRO|nr:hypothetical protein M9H77_14227 [Catharanthus roseus]
MSNLPPSFVLRSTLEVTLRDAEEVTMDAEPISFRFQEGLGLPVSKSQRKGNRMIESVPRLSPSRVVDKYCYHIDSNKCFSSQVQVYNFIENGICLRTLSSNRKEDDENSDKKMVGIYLNLGLQFGA